MQRFIRAEPPVHFKPPLAMLQPIIARPGNIFTKFVSERQDTNKMEAFGLAS